MTTATCTIALIRLVLLMAWAFYAFFEKDLRRLIWALVIALAIGNVVAIMAEEYLKVPGV